MNNTNISDALSNNYMLADLNIRMWGATKTDREVTAELAEQHGTEVRAVSVVKKLLGPDHADLKAVASAFTAIRLEFYARTLPFTSAREGKQRGRRLVACSDVINFMRDIDALKRAAGVTLDRFMDGYASSVAHAAATLGTMYNVAHYPHESEIRRMFGATMVLAPVPATGDFSRLTVPAALATGLQALYAKNMEKEVENALVDVKERMSEALQTLQRQLSKVVAGEKTKLHQTLLGNLRVVTKLARSMAPLDADMGVLADSVEAELLQHTDVGVFRDNISLSRATADRAAGLQAALSGGPGPAQPNIYTPGRTGVQCDVAQPSSPELSIRMMELAALLAQAEAEDQAATITPVEIPDDAFNIETL